MEFAMGNARLVLSQEDVAKAIEFWLNERILKNPCKVTKMTESRVNDRSTFEVIFSDSEQTVWAATTATVTTAEDGITLSALHREMGQR